MIKFLIVLGIFIIILLTVVIRIKKKLNSFLQNFIPRQETHTPKKSDDEVVYNRDDVVVLKGDAGKKKEL
jgi:hypothetical protein